MPCSKAAAACSKVTPIGIGTTRSAGATAYSENAAPCDPVAFLEMGDAFADRNHCSCSFLSGCERKLIAITPLPHIEVDEVYPGHSNTNQHLAFLGYGSGNLPQVHNLGTTSFREFNRLHRDLFLCVISTALLTGGLGSAPNPSMTCEKSPST